MFAEMKMTIDEKASPVGSRIRGKEMSQVIIEVMVHWIIRVLLNIKKYKVVGRRIEIRAVHR